MARKKDSKKKNRMADKSIEDCRIDWINKLIGPPPSAGLTLGIGDDAAVWKPRRGYRTVLTVDSQSEGTHFLPGWLSPEEIGAKAVSSSISDLAAMNARPTLVLVSLLLETRRSESYFRKLYTGIAGACEDYGALIAGGNISRGPLSITITCIGEARQRDITSRTGLENGDELWVTGAPGLARLGLLQLKDRIFGRASSADVRQAVAAFRSPRARLAEAAALKRTWLPHAVIDLSDGLGKDLPRLLNPGSSPARLNQGIILEREAFDTLEPLNRLCLKAGLSPLQTALEGGEDYELLLAIPAGKATEARVRSFRSKFGVSITRLGIVSSNRPGLWLKSDSSGSLTQLSQNGFEHF